ncbi:Membrane protein [Vibrio crassostreae]|nr:Membrane protein [Vibrio crassostreae]
MTRKAIITWIGIVSGLITILLVFENPFKDKAELFAYVENQETLSVWKSKDEELSFDTQYALKMTLKNVGELVAKDVHVKAKNASGFAVIKHGRKYSKFDDSSSIYVDRLEPGAELEIYFWGAFYSISHYGIDEEFSVSSPDSGLATLRGDIKGDNIIWYVEKYFIFIVVGLFLLLVVGTSIKASDNSDNDPNEKLTDFESEMEKLNYAWSIDLITEEEFKSKGQTILNKYLNPEK